MSASSAATRLAIAVVDPPSDPVVGRAATAAPATASATDAEATLVPFPLARRSLGRALSVSSPQEAAAGAWRRRVPPSSLRVRLRSGTGPVAYPDNTALLAGLVRRQPNAWKQFLERFGPAVEGVVVRTLGVVDSDRADVIQEVFVQVLERIHQLRDPPAMKSWVTTVALFTARGHIRKRRQGRWLRFAAPADLPETPIHPPSHDERAVVRATNRVLEALPAEERTAFSLRFIRGMELNEVAAACEVSLATVKRRLGRAEARFVDEGRRDAELCAKIERGDQWELSDAPLPP